MNIFERAVREKTRFNYKGLISVEDLWDLSLEKLDAIWCELEAELEKITHPFGLLSYTLLEAVDLVKKGLSYDFEETSRFYHDNFHKMDEEYISY